MAATMRGTDTLKHLFRRRRPQTPPPAPPQPDVSTDSGRNHSPDLVFRCRQRSPNTPERVAWDGEGETHGAPAGNGPLNALPASGDGMAMARVPPSWHRNGPPPLSGSVAPTALDVPLQYPGVADASRPRGAQQRGAAAGILGVRYQCSTIDELGLHLAKGVAITPGRLKAAEVLLASGWRALMELYLAQMTHEQACQSLVRADHHARAQLAAIARGHGVGLQDADALGRRAAVSWRRMVVCGETLPIEADAQNQVASRAHEPAHVVAVLERISMADADGPLRLAYWLGATLHFSDNRRSLDGAPAAHLACNDDDFEALLRAVWSSPQTDSLLQVYRLKRRALGVGP